MKSFLLLCVLLGACTTDVVTKPTPIDVPVSIPCRIPLIAAPTWSTDGITDRNTLFEQVRALLATNEQHKAYESRLVAANTACQ